MELYNIGSKEIADILDKEGTSDDYRKMVYFDENNALAFYYKDFLDLQDHSVESIDKEVKLNKKLWNQFEYTWEHYKLMPKITLINRLEEIKGISKLKKPAISGLVLYKGYPVGTLIPMELLKYQPLYELKAEDLSLSDRKTIFDKASKWVEELTKRDVYPTDLYGGNIVVNPEKGFDVVLDALDQPFTVRIESKKYVKKMIGSGRDFKKESFDSLERIKKHYLK